MDQMRAKEANAKRTDAAALVVWQDCVATPSPAQVGCGWAMRRRDLHKTGSYRSGKMDFVVEFKALTVTDQ